MSLKHGRSPLESLFPGLDCNHRFKLWLRSRIDIQNPLKYGRSAYDWTDERIAAWLEDHSWMKVRVEDSWQANALESHCFEWLDGSDRQSCFMLNEIAYEKTKGDKNPIAGIVRRDEKNIDRICPRYIALRDKIILIFDLWRTDKDCKHDILLDMKSRWSLILEQDYYSAWLSGDSSNEKCFLAKDKIEQECPYFFKGISVDSELEAVQCFFDSPNFNHDHKKLLFTTIKRSWSQKKHRAGLVDRNLRQYNFVLSDETIGHLDALAKKCDMKRTEVLERLLRLESQNSLHLDPWVERRKYPGRKLS
ncbi:hypothetical protein [Laribacter hongkongensis]|uniref:hypothetical protein n=1 Tax=Laribacter hongkongensis TaxID=168471 RepID=UPI001EFD4F88|nr:hypothetical protein [Laribacter hongkongensis]MCG9081410.1 hypothetical protein [Laribacter hongkongensis]